MSEHVSGERLLKSREVQILGRITGGEPVTNSPPEEQAEGVKMKVLTPNAKRLSGTRPVAEEVCLVRLQNCTINVGSAGNPTPLGPK